MRYETDRLASRVTRLDEARVSDVPGRNIIAVFGTVTPSLSYLEKKVGCLKIEPAPANQVADAENKKVIEGWIPDSHYNFLVKSLGKAGVERFVEA